MKRTCIQISLMFLVVSYCSGVEWGEHIEAKVSKVDEYRVDVQVKGYLPHSILDQYGGSIADTNFGFTQGLPDINDPQTIRWLIPPVASRKPCWIPYLIARFHTLSALVQVLKEGNAPGFWH